MRIESIHPNLLDRGSRDSDNILAIEPLHTRLLLKLQRKITETNDAF